MGLMRDDSMDHAEVDTEGSWAISYGDMITLLLTFFVLFYSTDSESERQKRIESSLVAAINGPAQPAPMALGGTDPEVTEEMQRRLAAQIHKVGGKLIVEFPQVSFFKLGATELTDNGARELARFVQAYQPYAGNYVLGIRAYTDHKKVRPGKHRYRDNLELSALRSIAAMRSLQQLGIPLNRMRISGQGELNLSNEDLQRAVAAAPEHEREGLAMARKIILVVEPELRERL